MFALLSAAMLAITLGAGGGSATKSSGANGLQTALSERATKGEFAPRVNFPADSPVMIHASVLPDGRVMFWGRDKVVQGGSPTIYDEVGRSTVRIWNPVNGTFESANVNNGTTNLFCSGHSLLPDGRLFVTGGHKHAHPNSRSGDERTNIFDPVTKSWSNGPAMQKGRWYPFNVTLDTGEVGILAGTYQRPDQPVPNPTPPAVDTQKNPEIYNPKTNTLEVMNPSATGLPTYPYVFLDPLKGDDPATGLTRGVFIAGPRVSYFWNPRGGNGKGSWSSMGLANSHSDGSAVMYDSELGGVLLVGGRSNSNSAISTAQKIILNQPNPQWQPAGQMNRPRSRHTATILPDGKVLVTGGVPCFNGYEHTPCHVNNPQFDPNTLYDINITSEAELWDPATGQWQLMAKAEKPRGYHSVGLLLPDATVLVGGYGNPDGLRVPPDAPDGWLNVRRHTTGERNVEVYSPPYLFDANGNYAARPTIESVPTQVVYGQQFSVTSGNTGGVSRVAWVRLPSVTHGFNQDQRINVLKFSASFRNPDQLTVTAPGDPRKCPPGYYMLFVFNSSGVPSKARIVNIQNRDDFIARRAIRHGGLVHLFYRHLGDMTLRYVKQTAPDSPTFAPPITAGGSLNSSPVAIPDANGRLQVIFLGPDNTIYSIGQGPQGGDTWSLWSQIGSSASSLPVIAAARNLDGRIQVFYRGADNALWYITQTAPNGGVWTAPASLGGIITSEPSVGMNADGRLEVFARGADNALYHQWQTTAGGSWSGWHALGGQLTSGPFVARQSGGQLDVFVRGTDNGVHHIRQSAPNSSQSWSSWQALGGSVMGDHQFNNPVAELSADGRLQVFVRWNDGTLRTTIQNADGTYPVNNWFNLGGWIDATLPPPVRGSNGLFNMFVRGASSNLYFNRQADANFMNWSGFTYLGDAAHSF